MNVRIKTVLTSTFAALLGIIPSIVLADQALVVGVNGYPNLPAEAQLQGSDNDADGISAKLRSLGFSVTEIKDQDATKTGILGALSQIQNSIRPNERFVFYFAGHGTKTPDGSGAILASDANPADHSNWIGRVDLNSAIEAVTASAKTVILDSCFSGAMARGIGEGSSNLRPRFYNFFGMTKKSIQIVPVNGNDSMMLTTAPAPTNDICYFLASNSYQRAYEDSFGGIYEGVFTHYFLSWLPSTYQSWTNVQTDVTASVLQDTQEHQSPILTPAYSSVAVFNGLTSIGPNAITALHRPVQSLWQTFSEDHPDSSQVRLFINPNLSSVPMGEKFTLSVDLNPSTGYLVLLELDTDGNLDLLFPQTRQAVDGEVEQGTMRYPTELRDACTVNKVGAERVKAILFRSRQDAQSLLDNFQQSNTIDSISTAMGLSSNITDIDSVPFFTSTIGFTVTSGD
jgi:hypothetical protein